MITTESNTGSLQVVVTAAADGVLVTAAGEVDLYTVASFEPPIMKGVSDLVSEPCDRGLTVDLTNVEFIDSCGLAVLLKARNSTREDGRAFHVVLGRNTQPARVMRLGRFDVIMALHYSED